MDKSMLFVVGQSKLRIMEWKILLSYFQRVQFVHGLKCVCVFFVTVYLLLSWLFVVVGNYQLT